MGLELAILPGRLALSVAAVNGNLGSTLDNNEKPAYAAQAIYRTQISPVGLGLGGSFWRNEEPSGVRTAAGPYGYLKLGELLWLAQVDWSSLNPDDPLLRDFTALTHSHEITYRAARGVELRGILDFHDPDLDRKSGSRSRYGAGVVIMPVPFVSMQATFSAHRFDRGELAAGKDYNQLEVQLHLFY